uniref:LRRNT domain-containing protein n=1 Tax=Anopheles quadriannulatus TaxID=34691 RepID=A0A182XN31_ANOQN
MLRLIATILAVVGIWLPQAAHGGVRSDDGDTLPILPQAGPSGGNFCQRHCPCLGNAIDCSKKNLKTLAVPMPSWVDNL